MQAPTRTDFLLLAVAVVVILVPTLLPIEQPMHEQISKWVWGELSSSDLFRNLILFMPLGAVLARIGWGAGRCVALAALFSLCIEILQLWIPGRFVSPLDLFANSLGAALGHAVLRWAPLWRSPSPAQGRVLVVGAGSVAAGLLLATGPLLAPTPLPETYFVQWVTADPRLHPYGGEVLAAELDGQPLPHGPFRAKASRDWISSDYALKLSLRAGAPPPGLSSFLRIWDPAGDEILLVGPDQRDLVVRYRMAGRHLGLEWAALRWSSGLAGVGRGQRIDVSIERTGTELCISVGGSRRCGLGFSHADLWQLLAPAFRYPPLVAHALTSLWLAGLLLPLGFWGRRDTATLFAWLLVAGSVALATHRGELQPIPLPALLAAATAILLGAGSRRFSDARLAAPRNTPTQ